MIARYPDWDKRLFKYLLEQASATHKYGGYDCAMFTCGGVMAESGVDLMYDWRGWYDSFESAKELMRKRFKRGLMQAITAKAREFEIPEIVLDRAMTGDVAAVKCNDQLALGLFNDGRVMVAQDRGYTSFPASEVVLRVWHIG